MAFDDFKAAVLITGGTGGIGLHCAQQIALQRPDLLIVVASRSPPKIASPANITYIPLDLVSRASTHKLVDEWRFPPLIALVCNAALFTGGKPTFTPEGIEETFAACHLGHALLFFLLNKPTPGSGAVSKLAPDCRIVTVTSGLHDPEEGGNPIKPIWTSAADTAAAKGLNDPNVRYPSVKVGVALFSNVLARKAKEEGKAWTCLLYDPGFAPGTSLTRYQPPIVRFFVTRIFPHALWLSRMLGLTSSTPLESGKALAALALGTGTMRDAESGSYWQIWKSKPSANNTYDKMLQEDLWSWTMRELEGEGNGFGKL